MGLFLGTFEREPKDLTFDGQDNNEQILLFLRQHVVVNFKWILMFSGLIFAPYILNTLFIFGGTSVRQVLPGNYYFVAQYLYWLFCFGFFFENFLSWFFHSFIISDKRVVDIDFYGLIHRRFSEAPLRNIEDITNEISGLTQVVFRYGNVVMQTAGQARELEFENVPNPDRVQDIISDLISALKEESE